MRLVFFGTPEFAVPALEQLARSSHEIAAVVAQPDRPAGRGMRLRTPAVATKARELHLPLVQPASVRSEEFLSWFRSLAPEVGVVVAYGRILPGSLLSIPPRGLINLHGSLLPKYRGAAPIQRAIEQGERVTGATIMRIDEQLDHGPVLSRCEIAIDPEERAPSLARRMAIEGARLLVQTLDRLESGEVDELEQDHDRASFAPKITKEESRVDWQSSAKSIYDRFRAFWPWPGLQAEMGGEPLKLVEIASPVDRRGGTPGEILAIDDDEGITVATAAGALRILRVQRPGKAPVSAAAWARSAGITVGDPLG